MNTESGVLSRVRFLFTGPPLEAYDPANELVPAMQQVEAWLADINAEPNKHLVTAQVAAVSAVISQLTQASEYEGFTTLAMGTIALDLARELSRLLTLALTGELNASIALARFKKARG